MRSCRGRNETAARAFAYGEARSVVGHALPESTPRMEVKHSALKKAEAALWLALAASAFFSPGDADDRAGAPDRSARPSAAPEPARRRPAFDIFAPIRHIDVKALLWDIYNRFANDRVMSVSAGVTYFAILSVFPALAAAVSLYALGADPTVIQRHLQSVGGFAPDAALQIVGDQLQRISSSGAAALGASFLFSLALSLWSANTGVKALFDALNIVYDVRENRGFLKLNFESLTFTAALVAFVALAMVAIVAAPALLILLGVGFQVGSFVIALRWPAMFVGSCCLIAALFHYGPSLSTKERRRIVPGAVAAAVIWMTASAGFSWYAANYGSYNQTYGALGAVIITMTWLWISLNIVLVGAQLNASLDRRHPLPNAKRADRGTNRLVARFLSNAGDEARNMP